MNSKPLNLYCSKQSCPEVSRNTLGDTVTLDTGREYGSKMLTEESQETRASTY